MRMETMALLVTRKTYSIAVACLSAEVLEIAPEDIYGQFLVINEPAPRWSGDPTPTNGFRNRLYGVEEFYDRYKVPAGDQEDGQFFKVKRLRLDETRERQDARMKKGHPVPQRVQVEHGSVRYAGGRGGFAR